jgi:hypothetical protein
MLSGDSTGYKPAPRAQADVLNQVLASACVSRIGSIRIY